jgi:hypothetical protein
MEAFARWLRQGGEEFSLERDLRVMRLIDRAYTSCRHAGGVL